MNSRVKGTIEKYGLIQSGDTVIAALSGGADSVCLLNILISLKEYYDLTVYAFHLNHNIRGEEAKRDENFCRRFCESRGIKLFTKSVDIKQLSLRRKISEELCGRNERYRLFGELASEFNAKVATAHTASDNAETLLFNLARGSSVRGLSAIPPKRDYIIRPLIEQTRADIEKYCAERGLEYVTDSTNLSDGYTRNRIRHNAVPVMKSVNSRFEYSALRLSENAREVCEYLGNQASAALGRCRIKYGYSREKLLELEPVILKFALVKICETEADFVPESRHLELILKVLKNGGAVELNKKYTLISKQNILRISDLTEESGLFTVRFQCGLGFDFSGKSYHTTEIKSDKDNINSVSSDFPDNAVFRTRRSGDKFTYLKRNVKKPLRKVMNENKIPSELRDKTVVLADGSTILWCEGIGASADGKNNSDKEIYIDVNAEKEKNNAQGY